MLWSELRAQIYVLLKDDGTRWTQADMLVLANIALRQIGAACAKPAYAELTIGSDELITLPTDCLAVSQIVVDDLVLRNYQPDEGEYVDGLSEVALLDWPTLGRAWLPGYGGRTARLFYQASWGQIADDSSTIDFGRYGFLYEAMAAYVCYLAHMREGVTRASLEQWSIRPENVVGNPLLIEARAWLEAYERILRVGLPGTALRFR